MTPPRDDDVSETLSRTDIDLPLLRRGKVRDVYDLGDALLFVATDRVSAFDVVLPQAIPLKGEVLTLISAWWFARTADIVPNHMLSVDPDEMVGRYPALSESRPIWARRGMLVRKLAPLPIECVVRGYIAGSAWKEYSESATLAGERLPAGLLESARLDLPIFSPATKADEGHDENITFARAAEILGRDAAARVREISVALYERGRAVAEPRGIIVADTKFEFGTDESGIRLMDEVLTPDSSRFWPADAYEVGRGQPSLDKQPVRDWLEARVKAGAWDRRVPAPDLPDHVVVETSERYVEVFERLTGTALTEVDLATWART